MKKTRPDFIKHCEELVVNDSFSYTGDNETFGTGASLGRNLGLKRIGINYEILQPGDCVGLPPGTGHAHTLLNNSAEVVKAIVVGDSGIPNDKIFYPKHPKRNEECMQEGFFWEGHPQNEMGPHDGWTDGKRPRN